MTSGSVFSAARLSILALFVTAAGAHAEGRVVEIARGHSWVSPYWGYSSPKIVSDGTAWYTAGLWGADPDSSYGVLYKCDGAAWHEGAHLSNIYQPVTLALDTQGRLLAAYTEQLQPVRIYRSQARGNIHDLERLPSPPDMKNAYYIGIAIREDVLYLAYLVTPEYSMFLATLNLASLEWTPSRLVCPGQIERKPKTAWTYPILYPAEDGLHLVASNAPDGGEGNTYNQVWYLFYPHGAHEPSIRELVAETPMGHQSYALDFAIDADGTRHTLFLWNQRKYGDPLPPDSPPRRTLPRVAERCLPVLAALAPAAGRVWGILRLGNGPDGRIGDKQNLSLAGAARRMERRRPVLSGIADARGARLF